MRACLAASGYTGATWRVNIPRETLLATRTLFATPSGTAAPSGRAGEAADVCGVFESDVALPSAETSFSMILSRKAKSIGSVVETLTAFPFLMKGLNFHFFTASIVD